MISKKRILKTFGRCYRCFKKILISGLIILVVSLALLELSFRGYVINFYGYVFEGLNPSVASNESKETLMLIGDSFTAYPLGYPAVLRDSLPEYYHQNISVPGTSIREQFLFGRNHIKQSNPKVIVYQFYVGNDLFGWDHTLNWQEVSFARNTFWWSSERIWVLSFLNFRLISLVPMPTTKILEEYKNANSFPFSPDLYSYRDKLYFVADSFLVENSISLKNGREEDFQEYASRLKHLLSYASEETDIYILIIPHRSQVSKVNLDRMKSIGASFSEEYLSSDDYPLKEEFESYFSGDNRIQILDPLPYLKKAEEAGVETYYNNDSHLNQQGQYILGQFILTQIKESGVNIR
ncbi:hypothetical protein [Roseivirga pacifica]|uniref:hypothetical protein n=1 Tax=Roseivirga pacifica TaxID=1267423 RepID=UPI003BAAF3D7